MKRLLHWLAMLAVLLPVGTFVGADSGARIVTGDVVANRSVTLATRIMGRITRVNALEGDRIRNGQVIVELDDTEYQARLKIAQASLERADAELAHRERTRKRLEKLLANNNVSREAIDEAIYAHEVAAANVKAAQAEIESIDSTLAETRIRAPFDAVVIDKFAETGLVTQPGQALYEIQDQSRLKFRARVKERDLVHIQIDDVARIEITALGGEPLEARVTKVIPNGDERHTFLIELALPERPGLYPGMFGKAIFE